MGKIGDLWVRLGLKKDDYTKGIKEATREGEGFGKGIAALSSKAKIAFAAVAAAVVGVIKAVKDLAQQNQALGDAWNKMTAGMAAGWDVFKTAVANMDFTHLLSNMREASRLARNLYDAKDALGEIGSSYDIAYGDQLKTIRQLEIELRDLTLSDEKRLAAGRKLLEIYGKLEKDPTRGMENFADASVDKMADRLGYKLKGASKEAIEATRREVKDFFIWLGTAQGEAYNAAAKKVAQTPLGLSSNIGMNFMRNAANNGMDRFALLAFNYNKNVGDKAREEMAKAIRAAGEQAAKFDTETRRIQTQMNSILSQDGGGGVGGGTTTTPDPFEQRLAEIRAESAEIAAIRASDEEVAREAAEGLRAWEESRQVAQQSLKEAFGPDMAATLEDGLDAAVAMGEEMDALKEKALQLSEALADQLVSAIQDGLVGAFNALADVIGGVTDGDMTAVAKALLEPLADMAIKAGTIIMMTGEAIESLKAGLINFFGGSPVVAGAALIGVGLAAKAGLAALGNRGGSGAGVSSYSSSASPYGGANGVSTAELVVRVEGEVKGSSIVLSGQNTLKNWNR